MEEIIRDMQILIKPEMNTPPGLTTTPEQNELITLKATETVEFDFTISDSEDAALGGLTLFNVTGESIQENTEVTQEQLENVINGNFKWTPTLADIRLRPYQIVFKATDSQGLATFRVFQIQVVDNITSIPLTFQQLGFQLFPNPATTQVQLTFPNNQINQSATITIFDNLGRLIQQQKIEKTLSKAAINIAVLQRGQYTVQIQTPTAMASTLLVVY